MSNDPRAAGIAVIAMDADRSTGKLTVTPYKAGNGGVKTSLGTHQVHDDARLHAAVALGCIDGTHFLAKTTTSPPRLRLMIPLTAAAVGVTTRPLKSIQREDNLVTITPVAGQPQSFAAGSPADAAKLVAALGPWLAFPDLACVDPPPSVCPPYVLSTENTTTLNLKFLLDLN